MARPLRPVQSITLPMPPSDNDRLTVGTDHRSGKVRIFLEGPVRQYRKGLAQLLPFLVPVPKDRPCKVDVVAHFAAGDPGDLQNRLKILLDVLTGHAYEDDSQIDDLHISRVRYQRRSAVHVTITALPPYTEPALEKGATCSG